MRRQIWEKRTTGAISWAFWRAWHFCRDALAALWCGLGRGRSHDWRDGPRICSGDVMLYWRLSQSFNEGDVVVYTADGEERLGRVVARPGDEVTITESGELMVNGAVVVESDITTPTPRYESAVDYPVHLGTDELFVLADLREGGHDSRLYGPIARSQIKGNVISVLRRSNL